MSRFSYTYNTLLALELKHPEAVSVKNHVIFKPSEHTSQLFKELQLQFRTTETGFILAYRTSTVSNKTLDTNGNPVTTTSVNFDWLDISNLNHTLEFYCIASKAFIENTNWENLGPREPEPDENPLTYSYNLYEASYKISSPSPDINTTPGKTGYKLENGDYNRMQVAKIDFILSGHIPDNNHKNNTIII